MTTNDQMGSRRWVWVLCMAGTVVMAAVLSARTVAQQAGATRWEFAELQIGGRGLEDTGAVVYSEIVWMGPDGFESAKAPGDIARKIGVEANPVLVADLVNVAGKKGWEVISRETLRGEFGQARRLWLLKRRVN